MGFFGKLLGKKEDDDLGLDDIGHEFRHDTGTYGEPLGSPDAGMAPHTEPHIGSLSAPAQQRGLTPEAFGFEKVNEKESSLKIHDHKLGEINIGKDLELISAKLDAIKAELDSVNQRLKRMERLAEGVSSVHKDKWSY